ncbi:hypothetical protein FOA52_000727 [Chlamydomonas sp. UWO 241]|nr:hypothetical protein FOA52_000727 [Chlamydomonas sp. UWO 241]
MQVAAYQMVEPDIGCCKCDSLNAAGIIAFVVLLLFFWPLAWLPCVIADCHQQSQRPVFGYPPGAPGYQQPPAGCQQPQPPMAAPVPPPPGPSY